MAVSFYPKLANVSEELRWCDITERFVSGLRGPRVEEVTALPGGHQSVKVTEKYYAAWTASRQRQIEADLQRAWDHDPLLLLETKGTPQVHGKTEAVN